MAQMQSHSIARKLAVLKRRFHLTKPKCLAAGLIVMVLVGGLVFYDWAIRRESCSFY